MAAGMAEWQQGCRPASEDNSKDAQPANITGSPCTFGSQQSEISEYFSAKADPIRRCVSIQSISGPSVLGKVTVSIFVAVICSLDNTDRIRARLRRYMTRPSHCQGPPSSARATAPRASVRRQIETFPQHARVAPRSVYSVCPSNFCPCRSWIAACRILISWLIIYYLPWQRTRDATENGCSPSGKSHKVSSRSIASAFADGHLSSSHVAACAPTPNFK